MCAHGQAIKKFLTGNHRGFRCTSKASVFNDYVVPKLHMEELYTSQQRVTNHSQEAQKDQTTPPWLSLQVPFYDLRQSPCKERAESLKTKEKLSSRRREKKEKIKKLIGIIQRDNGQEFNIILQRQPQIQEPQIIPSRITNNKIKWNRKKEHLNMLYKIVEHQREKNRLENNQIKDRWFTKGGQFYSPRQ